MNRVLKQLCATWIITGGIIALPLVWEPNSLLPDYRAFIPRTEHILIGAGAFSLLILLYHYWFAQFERILEALLILITAVLIGYLVLFILVGVFHYSKFNDLASFWNYVLSPPEYTFSHLVGHIIRAVVFLGVAWEALKIVLGFNGSTQASIGTFHHRGRSLVTYSEAESYAKTLIPQEDPSLFWAMMRLPSSVASSHFAIVGSTGSGKTISIRLLMQSVLPLIGTGKDHRALIYDAKQDMYSILKGINPPCEIMILNPFDKRGVAWDMAKDITSPATAQQIASILIPENKNASQPFFADAARHLLSGVFISFIKLCPEKWSLRDVLVALKSKERLSKVLLASPETSDLVEQYFSDATTARNVMSTVATKMQRYEFIAAAWSKAEKSISLRDWLKSESILILGNDEATRTALDAINQVIFKRLSELILAQTESESRRTWIFLDELRQAGKLEGLSSLLTKGRSKGASMILGYQDIEGLREVYGHQLANEIAGQCANKAILRCDSSDTAKWASALFGEREVLERRESVSQSSGSSHHNYSMNPGSSSESESKQTSEQVLKRDVVLPSQIMDILPTTPQTGLTGYYLTPIVGAYYVTADGDFIKQELIAKDSTVLDVDPRPESDQYLQTWGNEDLERLCLEGNLEKNLSDTKEQKEEIEKIEGIKKSSLFEINRKN